MTKDGKIIQKNIYKWDELEKEFVQAYLKHIAKGNFVSQQEYLHLLIRHGCKLEMRRKK